MTEAPVDYEFTDPLGNRLTVEPLNNSSVIVKIIQDDGGIDGALPPQEAQVIITLDDLDVIARITRSSQERRD
jgi:hypothetical protein